MTDITAIVPALVGGGGGGFELEDLRVHAGEVVLSLRRTSDGGRVDLVIGGRDTPGAVWRGSRCAVRYSTKLETISRAEREELRDLVGAFGGGTDRWLAAHPGASPAELAGAFSLGSQRVPFTPEGLLSLLGLRLDAELPAGWRLAGIYPSSMISESDSAYRSLVIELAHARDGVLRAELGPRNDGARAFARSAHLDLSYLTLGSAPPASAARAMRLLGLLLRLRDGEDVEIEFVPVAAIAPLLGPGSAVPALPGTSPSRTAEWLNLAINTPCAQACQFCSVQDVSPPWTDDLHYERVLLDLRSNAEAGVRRVRINGYDPLTYPRILDVAHAVRQLGYLEVMVFSPCTTLAAGDVLDALLDALPANPSFHVPVYGPNAEIHDRVVGRPGAFERVARALELLGARLPRENLVITSVAVQDNVGHLIELREWALARAIRFHVQTPYPSSESPADRFRTSVASFRHIASETMRAGEHVIVNGVPPCVYFERGEALGLDPACWIADERRPLPGREYVEGPFSHRALVVQHSVSVPAAVACPHQQECALATACPREVLLSYADVHGLGELSPVPLRSLLRRGSA